MTRNHSRRSDIPKARPLRCAAAARVRLLLLSVMLSVAGLIAGAAQGADDQPISRWYGRWVAADPARLGYDNARLHAAIEAIGAMRGVQGLIVLRRGYLVAEHYWRGGALDVPHNMKSASKSVMSALTGIAVARGDLALDQPVVELLPDRVRVADPAKRKVTVRHLLTMTSGLQSASYQGYDQWVTRDDWTGAVLRPPLEAEPGERFGYSTGNTHLLSAILSAQTGNSTRQFANDALFTPMDIDIQEWQTDPDGIPIGGNNLWLMPRDLAKFGQLYLDRGRWGDRQLLDPDWIRKSTAPGGLTEHETYGDYGFLWWVPEPAGSFVAVGYGGQYILVTPRDDTVVVITSTLDSKGDHWEGRLFELLRSGIADSLVDPALPLTAVVPVDSPLRDAPQPGAPLVGDLTNGQVVDVLDQRDGWALVHAQGRQGWVADGYIRMHAAAVPELPAVADRDGDSAVRPPFLVLPSARLDQLQARAEALEDLAHEPAPLPTYRVSRGVNFRRSPSLRGERLRTLQAGTEFQALERSESWLMARVDGQLGWLHSDFVEVAARPSPQDSKDRINVAIGDLVDAIADLDRVDDDVSAAPTLVQELQRAQAALGRAGRDADTLRTVAAQHERALLDATRALSALRASSDVERDRRSDEIDELKQALGRASAKIEALRKTGKMQQAGLDEELAGMQTINARLEDRLATSQASMSRLQHDLQQAQARNTTLTAQAEQQQDATQALDGEMRQLTETVQQRTAALERSAAQIAQLQGDAKQAAEQHSQVEQALRDAMVRIETLGTQLVALRAAEQRSLVQAEQATVRADEQAASIERLGKANAAQQAALVTARALSAELSAALAAAREDQATLANQFEASRNEITRKDTELATLAETGRQQQHAFDAAQSELQSLKAALATSTERSEVAEQAKEAAQAALQDAKQALESQLASNQRQSSALSEAERLTVGLREKLAQRDQAIATLVTERNELTAARAAEAQEMTALTDRAAEQRQQLQDSASRVAALEQQLAGVAIRRADLAAALARSTEDNTALISGLSRTWMGQALALAEVDRAGAALASEKAAGSAAQQAAAAELARLRADLGLQKEQQQTLDAENDRLEAEVATTREALALSEDQVAVLGRERDALARARDLQTLKIATLTDSAAEQRQQLQGSASRVAALEQQLADVAARRADLDTALSRSRTDTTALVSGLTQAWMNQGLAVAEIDRARADQAAATVGRKAAEAAAAAAEAESAAGSVEIERLRNALALGEQREAALEKAVAQREEQRASVAAGLEKALAEKEIAQQRITALTQGLADRERAEDALRTQLSDLQANERRQREAIDAAHARVVELEARFSAAEQQRTELGEALAAAEAAASAGAKTSQGLQQRAVLQKARLDEAQTRIAALQADLAAAESVREALSAKLGQTEARAAGLVSDLAAQRGVDAERERAVIEMRARLVDLEASLQDALTDRDLLADALEKARGDGTKLAEQLAAIRARDNRNTEALEAAQARVAELETSLEVSDSERVELADALEKANALVETTEQQLGALQETDANQVNALEENRQRVALLEEQLKVSAGKIETLSARLQQGEQAGKAQADQLLALREAIALRDKALDDGRRRIVDLEAETASLATEKDELAAAVRRADSAAEALRGRLAGLVDNASAADTQRDKLLAELEQARLDVRTQQRIAEEMRQADNEQQKAQAALTTSLRDVRSEHAALAEAVDEITRSRDEARRQLAQSLQTIDALNDQLEDRDGRLGDALGEIATLNENVDALQEQTAALTQQASERQAWLEDERQRLVLQLDVSEKTIVRLKKLADERQSMLGKNAQALGEARTTIAGLRQAEQSLRDRLGSQPAPLPEIRKQLEAKRVQLADAEGQLGKQLESAVAQLAASPTVAGQVEPAAMARSAEPAAAAATQPVAEVVEPAIAPAPVVAPQSRLPGASMPAGSAITLVQDWASAWSSQDVDAYLGFYAADFRPESGASRRTWVAQRRQRLTRPKFIVVEIGNPVVKQLDPDHVEVTFEQAYQANHYRDRVTKTLALIRDSGSWKIQREWSR